MPGQLFTSYFLEDGICQTDAWLESESEPLQLDSFRAQALALLDNAAGFHSINEASTEQELIRPLLELLGWGDHLPQQGSDGNEDIPDFLLFGDAESKAHASAKPRPDRYVDALAVAESKRFGVPLDARDKEEQVKSGSPHAQILRYLATADISSDGRIRWGILTNGRAWRLYDRRARPIRQIRRILPGRLHRTGPRPATLPDVSPTPKNSPKRLSNGRGAPCGRPSWDILTSGFRCDCPGRNSNLKKRVDKSLNLVYYLYRSWPRGRKPLRQR